MQRDGEQGRHTSRLDSWQARLFEPARKLVQAFLLFEAKYWQKKYVYLVVE